MFLLPTYLVKLSYWPVIINIGMPIEIDNKVIKSKLLESENTMLLLINELLIQKAIAMAELSIITKMSLRISGYFSKLLNSNSLYFEI